MDVMLPRDTVSDDACRLVEIHVTQGQAVQTGDLLFTFESSKSTFEVCAESEGVIEWNNLVVDEFYPVAEPVAVVANDEGNQDTKEKDTSQPSESPATTLYSEKAQVLIAAGKPQPHSQLRFVSSRDLVADAKESDLAVEAAPQAAKAGDLDQHLDQLRQRMRHRFDRHVPTGTLLNDRWELAKQWDFGDGASCYDECLILGDVDVGENCWIGPFTILDGAHAKLTIGDRSSIGAGSQLYTHDTISKVLTGSGETHKAATTIGKNCFISPNVIISPGTTIGDGSLVATGSYVQGNYPANCYIAGNPAKIQGSVEIADGRFRVHRTI
jgi:acetyltransferase-like isoleucine patch superfamily enzyme